MHKSTHTERSLSVHFAHHLLICIITLTFMQTGGQYVEEEMAYIGEYPLVPFFEYSQYCHDGVWTFAYALNRTLNGM